MPVEERNSIGPFACTSCLAFAPGSDRAVAGKAMGQCRRQSPAPGPANSRPYVDAQWPSVRPDDWCCEYIDAATAETLKYQNRGAAA
ncbi:hypothetical protein [Beijerinckia sp. L45]|uniref:hypothetical protein n=1 Tax=Beijerinckia sp. L45 TaxID=1641855 RepID=UPI00131CD65D|nr:hypothetical protein [Beijerinckia sp. L45]